MYHMQPITRDELKCRLDGGENLILVEVIGPNTYREYHLPGAIRIPVDEDFERQIRLAIPDRGTPVVVYCLNHDCQASPKAGRKLDQLGYQNVYDYEAGKQDWRAAGLPVMTGAAPDD